MIDAPVTLLLVEDNDIDVDVVRRLLRRLSLDVSLLRARDGEEALALLCPASHERRVDPPFVVLLDINMPRMNGLELLDAIAADGILATAPVFMLSTSSDPRERAAADERGASGYVIKPIEADELLGVIETALTAPWRESAARKR